MLRDTLLLLLLLRAVAGAYPVIGILPAIHGEVGLLAA